MIKNIRITIACLIFAFTVKATSFDTLVYGVFGKVTIYMPATTPDAVVLFVSGDGGWNEGVIDMAKNIASQGALVAGIDIQHYYKILKSLKSKCYYPAGDFEELSLTLQKKYRFKQYLKPILVGYSSGATLVYGLLAQAPANTFKGAISLGFCPDIETDKPLCNGSGLKTHILKEGKAYYLEPCDHLAAPFIVLQGINDQVCSYADTKKYMEDIPSGELISLPKVGHGFSITKNWLPQFISAYQKVLKEPGYVEKIAAKNTLLQEQHLIPLPIDLPLTLIPSSAKEDRPLAFFISGDGGWTSFDQAVCERLAENGMPAVGLDAQKYFWTEKQPKEASDQIARAVSHYLQQWNRGSFVLIGYSFGACVSPFIADMFNDATKKTLKGVFCFSPDETGDFEIHIADMLSIRNNEKYDVISELKKIKSLNAVCIFGNEEDNELRNHFSAIGIRIELLPGNHHYENDYNAVAAIITKEIYLDK